MKMDGYVLYVMIYVIVKNVYLKKIIKMKKKTKKKKKIYLIKNSKLKNLEL